jgi:predicted DCC family thiol-disulfide oxidoreductase YuxK
MTMDEIARAVLIYDGGCPLCQEAVGWLSRRGIRGQFEFLPCQSVERRARFPRIEERACMAAMHLVLPDGRVLAGAAAAPEILQRLRGWRWLAAAFRLPGAGLLGPVVYGWIARHRYRMSALVSRRRPPR